MRVSEYLGILLAFLASFFHSITGLFAKQLTQNSALELAAYRFCIMLLPPSLSILYGRQNPFPKPHMVKLAMRSILGVFALTFHFYSVKMLPLGDASAISNTRPMFIPLLAKIIIQEPYGFIDSVITLMTVAGLVLIVQPNFLFGSDSSLSEDSALGLAASFGFLLFSSLAYIIMRRLKNLHADIILFNFAVFGVVCLLVTTALTGEFRFADCSWNLFLILCMCLSGFWQQLLTNVALQIENAGVVAMVLSMDVVLSYFWSFWIYNKKPNLYTVIGVVAVLSCVVLTGVRKCLSVRRQEQNAHRFNSLASTQ